MKSKSVNEILKKIFEAHEVDFVEESEWIFPYSKLPAVRATWYPNDEALSGLLQIEVFIEKGKILEECFAGYPTEEGKLNNAFENFIHNSFHVLLSAFWKKHDSEQVEIETWNIGEDNYTIYIGPFGNRGGSEIAPRIPKNAFNEIEKAIKNTDLSESHNWFRTFFCNLGNQETVYEALLNNKNWQLGIDTLKNLDWKTSNEYYSTRNFIIAIKNT